MYFWALVKKVVWQVEDLSFFYFFYFFTKKWKKVKKSIKKYFQLFLMHGAVDKVHSTLLHHLPDPVVLDINMLSLHMILVVSHECNHGLVVWKKCERFGERAKDFREEAFKPKPLLYPVHGRDVLALCGGKWGYLLLLRWLRDGTTINEECVARNGLPVLSHGAIGICVALEDVPCLTVQKAEVTCAGQVVEDPLDGLPMCRPGVCTKVCHSCDSIQCLGVWWVQPSLMRWWPCDMARHTSPQTWQWLRGPAQMWGGLVGLWEWRVAWHQQNCSDKV